MLATSSQTLWYLTSRNRRDQPVLLTVSVALGVSEVVRFASPGWPRFVLAASAQERRVACRPRSSRCMCSPPSSTASPRFRSSTCSSRSSAATGPSGSDSARSRRLLLAVIITSLFRERIGYQRVPRGSLGRLRCWPVAFVHSLGTGSRHPVSVGGRAECRVSSCGASCGAVPPWVDASVSIGARFMTALGECGVGSRRRRVDGCRADATRLGAQGRHPEHVARVAAIGCVRRSFPVPFIERGCGVAATDSPGRWRASIVIDERVGRGRNAAHLEVVIAGTPLAGGGVSMDAAQSISGRSALQALPGRGHEARRGTSIAATVRNDAGNRISLELGSPSTTRTTGRDGDRRPRRIQWPVRCGTPKRLRLPPRPAGTGCSLRRPLVALGRARRMVRRCTHGQQGNLSEVERSGLRRQGRGPVPDRDEARGSRLAGGAVVVANGTEGEPGSSKDTVLMTHAPHLVLDGAELAAEIVGARDVILCVKRGSVAIRFSSARSRTTDAWLRADPDPAGRCAPRYVSGEETALGELAQRW